MGAVCPVCNGLSKLLQTCQRCGMILHDEGMLTDFIGPYSPYELSPRTNGENGTCIHILHCAQCNRESYAIVQNDTI